MFTLQQLAAALNGKIEGDHVRCPGPGHSIKDDSLCVWPADTADGFTFNSHAKDAPEKCLEHIRQRLAQPKQPKPAISRPQRPSANHFAAMLQGTAAERRQARRKLVDSYHYTDATGTVLYEVLRWEPKGFSQRRPNGNGQPIWNLDSVERVIYRWPEVLASPSKHFVTEGETDCNRLWETGLPATTAQGNKWTDTCVQALAGYFLIILEDNDDPGRQKALQAAQALYPVATGIRIVRLPGLNEGGDVSDWLNAGHTRQEFLDFCNAVPDWHPTTPTATTLQQAPTPATPAAPDKSPPAKIFPYRRHRDTNNPATPYLIKHLLPETGIGLLSGQSGTYKSFVGIKLAGAVGIGTAFAGHAIKRQGATLIFASEGAGDIPSRLDALSIDEHSDKVLPIYNVSAAVSLLDKTSVATAIATARAIADEAQRDHKLPLALILFDTLIGAAQYSKSGDENDSAVNAKLMGALTEISRATGTFVLGIDHFGKAVETGTRGSSAKEAAADVVLALLADKALSGEVTAPRLCVRKRRNGPAGVEYPFTVKTVHLGTQDEDGEEITSLALDFSAAVAPPTEEDAGKWSPSLRPLRKIFMTLLATVGEQITPFADGPSVLAVKAELVRSEFYRQHASEQTDSKRRAFDRAVSRAQERDLIGVREITGMKWLWLLKP